MERKKRRWLLGCGLVAVVLGVSALGALAWLGWAIHSAWTKPGPVVEIVTFHPGMPASSIEKSITNRIERWCNQSPGAQQVVSKSVSGISIVRIYFRNDIDPNGALTMTGQLATGTLPTLPPDTRPPMTFLRDPRQDRPLGVVTASGSTVEVANLNDATRLAVRNQLSATEGAIVPTILFGRPDRAVGIHIDGRPAVPIYLVKGAKAKVVAEEISKRLDDPRMEGFPPGLKLRWVPFGEDGKSDDGLLAIYLRGPTNARLEETEKCIAAVERFVEKNIPAKERKAILSEVGLTPDTSVAYSANAGPMDATLFVQLSHDRTLSTAAYASKLRRLLREEASFADLDVRFASRDMPAPVDIRIAGEKEEERLRLAQEVRRWLANIKGAVDVDIAQRMDAPCLLVTADRVKAAAVGLSPRDVLMQILTALQPQAHFDRDFWLDVKSGNQSSIAVPLPTDPKVKLEDVLETTAAGANAEQPIKLSSLATLKRTTAAVEIDHDSLQRVLDVRANIEERSRRDVIADIRKMLQELKVPEGMRVKLAE